MPWNFERSSLSHKLTLISFLSTGTALAFVFVAFAVTSVLNHRKDEGMQLSAFAGVIGSNSVDALLFRDPRQAELTLAALRVQDEISSAALFDRHGKLFASYVRERHDAATAAAFTPLPDLSQASLAAANARGGLFWSTRMRLYRPVTGNRIQIGVVMIEADLTAMWFDILKSLGVISAAMCGSLLVSMQLAGRFKRSIADPVAKLIGAAHKVSGSQNYTLRIKHQRTDELGTLIDSFNDMLAQIEGRGAALTHHRDELERQVSVRTEQLEKAKNAAEAASRAKSAFLATMSHEIRTPMNGVLGMTELLLGTELSETQRNYTAMVKRSGEHLLVIINDILDFSKIEAGKLTVEYINFNLRDLLDDIDIVYTPQAHAKSIQLLFEIANDIPVAVCGDPNRLRQVIANLLGNAIKFTERGQIRTRVAVLAEDAQKVSLRFEVHDTGIGVSREARGRIFDAFSQADSTTTRNYGGTGLGLAISRQLIELMGGKIGVENALTQGSIFWFTVTFDKRRVDADEPGAPKGSIEGLRVLVVNQQESSREALMHQLASWKVRSHSSDSAIDAFQQLQAAARASTPYDVALLDMELARTSGLALAAMIRADKSLGSIRTILISSERRAADPLQRLQAGVAYQLIKPARAGDLFECLAAPPRNGSVAAAPAMAAAPAPPVSARAECRCKVLLAEDNPVNVEVAIAMLSSLGLEVTCARNGEEALAAVRSAPFDLVLMDCQMPVMDGFAATAEIRRYEQHSGRPRTLPIIAITANALQGDREACLAAGMDDYLSKPFTQQELGALLGRWTALPPAPAPSPEPFASSPPAALPLARALAPAPVAAPAPAAAGAAPSAGRAAVNHHALDSIRALSNERGDALVQKVVAAYVDDTARQIHDMRAAITETDPGSLRRTAHSLKSSSANVGAEHLARLCKQLEQLGRNNSIEGASGILVHMEQEFQAVRQSLGALLEKES